MTAKKKKNKLSITKKTKYILAAMWSVYVVVVAAVILLFTSIANGWVGYMPPIEELQNPSDKFASVIYTEDGVEMGRYYQSNHNRVYVDYAEISPYLIQALIATEDERFYSHSGIDFKALTRAIVKRGILMQKSAGGGSTITQQLSKLLYSPLAGNITERLMQKPQEWVIATKLERLYTKEEIINMYLNHFDFLNNAVGIQSASQVYFDKDPQDLKVEEAATLIGMCKNPAYYNPRRFNERTRERRNVVLSQMERSGYLTAAQCDSLQQLPLTLNFKLVDHKEGLGPYYRERVRLMLTAPKPIRSNYASWEMQQYRSDSIAWATNPAYGWCEKNKKPDGTKYNIYTDGLKIYTSIDSRMQRYAEEAVYEHISQNLQPKFFKEKKGRKYAPFSRNTTTQQQQAILERDKKNSERYRLMKKAGASEEEIDKAFNTPIPTELFSYEGPIDTIISPMDSIRYNKTFLRAGFVVMDPLSGKVKAYVGGPEFSQFQYDMAGVGRRQIGSTIKPFLYTLAMEEGFSPNTLMLNEQPTFILDNGKAWSPRNTGKARIGEMVPLSWALMTSNNWISARLIDKLSPLSLARLMNTLGITNKIDPVLSLCLGTVEVSVEEMTTAYTAFSNNGVRYDPIYITRIEDNNGNIIAEFSPSVTEVFSQRANTKIVPILQDVVDSGTGVRMRYRYNVSAPMGGKTGTTNENADGWFMSFTPNLVTGTWVGGEDRDIHFDSITEGQGANLALPIAALFYQKVYKDASLREEGYTQDLEFDLPELPKETATEELIVDESAAYIDETIDGIFE